MFSFVIRGLRSFQGSTRRAFAGTVLAVLLTHGASADFHLNDIVEIFSNADGTIQYIEMRATANNEHVMAGHSFTSNSKTFVFPSNLPSSNTLNRPWLMATAGFASLPGAVTPDYVIPDNFFSTNGDTLTLVGGAWGAMTFGSGVLPTDGVNALRKNLTTATNSPTNFAGQSGQVNVPPLDPDNVFVDFDAGSNGTGAETSPFDNLADAIAAANAGATITLQPGSSAETFAGGGAVSKSLTLVNGNGGGGPVSIGASGARITGKSRQGFVSSGAVRR